LGVFFKGRGLQYKAIPLLTKAIELNPLDPISYVVRGISYFRTGELDHAKSDYETALEIEPNYLNALWVYAGLLIKIQKYNEAEKILTLCSKINPDDSDIQSYQAVIYAAKGQKEKALEIKIDNIWQVYIYSLLGMKNEAITLLSEIVNKDSYKDVSIYLSLKNNRYLDKLRNENRFKKILAEEKKKYEELLEKYNYN